jgi:lipopolysaccharide cholinephosphotransferase
MRNTSTIEWELARTQDFRHWYMQVDREKLKRLQEALLGILVDFDAFSLKHGLRYAIVAGTLIGSVRHGGWIPWDDDIDIVMPREDYQRLEAIVANDPIALKYVFKLPEKSKELSQCAKFMDKSLTLNALMGEGFSEKKHLYIDVLPVDFVPQNQVQRKLIGTLVDALSVSYASVRAFRIVSPNLYEMSKVSAELRTNLLIRRIIALPALLIGVKNTMALIQKLLMVCKSSDEVTIALGVKRYFGEILKADDLFPVKPIQFQGITLSGPNRPHEYLTNRYGDYMRVPPKEEQDERLIRLRDDWMNVDKP